MTTPGEIQRSLLSRAATSIGEMVLPKSLRRRIVRAMAWPPVGKVDFGALRRLTPISTAWGYDRGTPIDRYYIEQFLGLRSADIRGRVLEIGDNTYTLRFGGDRVEHSEILDGPGGNRVATYVDDLATGQTIPSAWFDCIICTQTLQVLPDMAAGIRTLHRALKPGGVLLATIPGICKIYHSKDKPWQDHWHVTDHAAAWLAEGVFSAANVTVEARGNILSALAFLHGLSAEELDADELAFRDPDFQVSVSVRAVRTLD